MTGRYQRAVDLLELIALLQDGPTGFSIRQIAEHFEVSRRTAERMLGALQRRFPELQPELRRGRKYWRFVPSGRTLADWDQEASPDGSVSGAAGSGPTRAPRRGRWLAAGAQPREALAGTIADALRGPVSTVGMIARSALEPGHSPEQALERISVLAERMSHTLDRTLQFVRREPLKCERTSPSVLLECVANEVRSAADQRGVEVAVDAAPELPDIDVDRVLLQSALSDLAGNALDAMPDGGRLQLKAEISSDGEGVCLGVEDTGAGISQGDEEWIFEPFYTTKNEGTGLGLSMVRDIAAAHSGRVSVSASASGGAVLSMEIPSCDSEQSLAAGLEA